MAVPGAGGRRGGCARARLGGAAISVALHQAQPGEPGAFYSPPSPLPAGPPGTIIRSAVIEDYFEGATTYRVLYLSTDHDGQPRAVSGIIVVPDGPAPAEGRRVFAYTHGTVGVAPRCGPSLQDVSHSPLDLEGGAEFIAAGYVIAASDYQGLGTPGPHPYLVGDVEAMNTLDSVRAARHLADARAGPSSRSGATPKAAMPRCSQGNSPPVTPPNFISSASPPAARCPI